jgi:hypothetical protein
LQEKELAEKEVLVADLQKQIGHSGKSCCFDYIIFERIYVDPDAISTMYKPTLLKLP